MLRAGHWAGRACLAPLTALVLTAPAGAFTATAPAYTAQATAPTQAVEAVAAVPTTEVTTKKTCWSWSAKLLSSAALTAERESTYSDGTVWV